MEKSIRLYEDAFDPEKLRRKSWMYQILTLKSSKAVGVVELHQLGVQLLAAVRGVIRCLAWGLELLGGGLAGVR